MQTAQRSASSGGSRYRLAVWTLAIMSVVFVGASRDSRGQSAAPPAVAAAPVATGYAPVMVEGRKLFDVMGRNGLSAVERADRINRRLGSLIARSASVPAFTRQNVTDSGHETLVSIGGEPIVRVTDADAQDALATRQEVGLLWGGKMAAAVADARATRANPIRGAGILIRNSFRDLLASLLRWLPRFGGAILLVLLFWLLARGVRWATLSLARRTHLDSSARQLLRTLSYYGTWGVGVIAILSTLGLESTGIATTLGVSGFVLGFAFKDILSHFFAGLMLLLGRQLNIGDQIVVGPNEGTVERIELRALYLRTYDNRLVIIPNGDVFTSVVTSNTASPVRRRDLLVPIAYGNDIAKAQQVALRAVKAAPGVATEPAPDVLVDELTGSSVNLRVRFYANSQRSDYVQVGSECMRLIKQAFDENAIAVPSAAQTVVLPMPAGNGAAAGPGLPPSMKGS